MAKQLSLGQETVCRWVVQSQVEAGDREGRTTEELAEIKTLKAKVRRLEEDNAIDKVDLTMCNAICSSQFDIGKGAFRIMARKQTRTEQNNRERYRFGCCVAALMIGPAALLATGCTEATTPTTSTSQSAETPNPGAGESASTQEWIPPGDPMAADKVSGKSAKEIQDAFTINAERGDIKTFEDFSRWYVYRWSSWVQTGKIDENITNMGRDGLESYLEETYDAPIMDAALADSTGTNNVHIAAHFGGILLSNACKVLNSPTPYKETYVLQSADGSLRDGAFAGEILFTDKDNFSQTSLPQNLSLLPEDAQKGKNRTYTVKLAGNILPNGDMKLTGEDIASVDNS